MILSTPKAEDHQANMNTFGFPAMLVVWGCTASQIAGYFVRAADMSD